jgi:hypothetical protein
LICNHCGKEVAKLSAEVAELHEQGLSPAEIRDNLTGRLRGDRSQQYMTVYSLLVSMEIKPHTKKRKNL